MEIKGAALLYTLSGLMITFAGFSALLFGVRQAAGARLSMLDRFIAKNVMSYIFILTAGALLPVLLALYGMREDRIWRAWDASAIELHWAPPLAGVRAEPGCF